MRVVCSYCKCELPEKEPLDDKRISHSVCPTCFDVVFPKEIDDDKGNDQEQEAVPNRPFRDV